MKALKWPNDSGWWWIRPEGMIGIEGLVVHIAVEDGVAILIDEDGKRSPLVSSDFMEDNLDWMPALSPFLQLDAKNYGVNTSSVDIEDAAANTSTMQLDPAVLAEYENQLSHQCQSLTPEVIDDIRQACYYTQDWKPTTWAEVAKGLYEFDLHDAEAPIKVEDVKSLVSEFASQAITPA